MSKQRASSIADDYSFVESRLVDMSDINTTPDENTPLLVEPKPSPQSQQELDDAWDDDGSADQHSFVKKTDGTPSFRRAPRKANRSLKAKQKAINKEDSQAFWSKEVVEPLEALTPLVRGGIKGTDGIVAQPRPAGLVKSIPGFAPYPRTARHRSVGLYWTNEFRHWWKNTRLLCKAAGQAVSINSKNSHILSEMLKITPLKMKSLDKMPKIIKHLGQGGATRDFLEACRPFTNFLRILVGGWRYVEAAPCRRLEVGVEETMGFIGNRVSRWFSKMLVDLFVSMVIIPFSHYMFKEQGLSMEYWHPAVICTVMGVLRAASPYIFSFQGSRAGRVLTRQLFRNLNHPWQPIQRVEELNMNGADCQESDEVTENERLVKLGRKVAKIVAESKSFKGQNKALAKKGFFQVGAGSDDYNVYEYHEVVGISSSGKENVQTILLHTAPYGHTLFHVQPLYVVLEHEDSQDRRAVWSESLDALRWQGPSLIEGYIYRGAFFNVHQFAELKQSYKKQLHLYKTACKAMSDKNTEPSPPMDPMTFKQFLLSGEEPREQRRIKKKTLQVQSEISRVARKLKGMLNKESEFAPRGFIIYLDGIATTNKVLTGDVLGQVLEQAGYAVETEKYNESRTDVWMDKAGPDTNEDGTSRSAVIWNHGPASDFVHGPLHKASDAEKHYHYKDFMEFDAKCMKNGIVFLKLMFVANRDAIAATLGERIGQKEAAQKFHSINDSDRHEVDEENASNESLEAMDTDIGDTSFGAFNSFQKYLNEFVTFAKHTDSPVNPWVVVNTSDYYVVQKMLLRKFEDMLDWYAEERRQISLVSRDLVSWSTREEVGDNWYALSEKLKREANTALSMSVIVALMGLLVILFLYSLQFSE